jgi:hypothetical protein
MMDLVWIWLGFIGLIAGLWGLLWAIEGLRLRWPGR